MLHTSICRLIFFTILLSYSFKSIAQPTYWQKENQKYLENYRQRIADNTAKPNNPYGTYSVDKNAIDELVQSWKRMFIPVKLTPAEKEEQKAAQAKRDAVYKEREDFSRELEQRLANKSVPYVALFNKAGFCVNSSERKLIIDNLALGCRGLSPNPFQAFAATLVVAKQTFESGKEKLPLNDLLPLITSYLPTWETALIDLNFLEKRFPASKPQIDTLRLLCHAYFFGAEYPTGLPLKIIYGGSDNCYDDLSAYKQADMLASFALLTENYEGMAMKVAATATPNSGYCYRNPLYQLITTYKNEPLKAAKYARLTLYTLPPFNDEKECTNWMGLFAFNDARKFYSSLSVDEWNSIAAAHGGSAMAVVKRLGFNGYELNVLPSKYREQRDNSYKTELDFWEETAKNGVTFNVLEKLAAGGDAEALNALAVGTGLGLTKGNKTDCIWMLQEAAKAGSVWARFNLVWAAGWGLKGYNDEEKTAAVRGFNQFIATADSATIITAASIVSNYQYIYYSTPKLCPWVKEMPLSSKRSVLKRAVENGVNSAEESLASKVFNYAEK